MEEIAESIISDIEREDEAYESHISHMQNSIGGANNRKTQIDPNRNVVANS